jgi:uncharacterized protein
MEGYGLDAKDGRVLTEGRHEDIILASAPPAVRDVVTLSRVRENASVAAYIAKANEQMAAIGYTEHGHRHAAIVAAVAQSLALQMGLSERDIELAGIAGYLHDIGNMVHRSMHAQVGACIVTHLLEQMTMDPSEIGSIAGAIGNHEESDGTPVSAVSAVLILADKSDVHFSRVQNPDRTAFDIHDRVNSAVRRSSLQVDDATRLSDSATGAKGETGARAPRKVVRLDLKVDTAEATVMEYFEIFIARMVMCRKAADLLGARFHLEINGVDL